MKKAASALCAILVLFSLYAPAFASNEPSAPICFGPFDGVRTVWAEYTSAAPEGSLRVTFPSDGGSGGGVQRIWNYTGGTLYLAVVSAEPLDLSQPLAWVSQEGSTARPALTLKALRFNEIPVATELTSKLLSAALINGRLAVSLSVSTPSARCRMIAATYQDGRMASVQVKEVVFGKPEDTLQFSVDGFNDAMTLKVFFLSEDYAPMGAALEIGKDNITHSN